MGEADIEKLNKIYTFANDFCKKMDIPYRFIEDSGREETAIAINHYGIVKKIGDIEKEDFVEYYRNGYEVFVPDILDFKHNRKDELIAFRSVMDQLYLDIVNSNDIPSVMSSLT